MDRMVTGIVLRCRDHRRPKTGLDAYRVPPRKLCERCRVVSLPASDEPESPDPPPADLAEIVRCYGLRTWVEQGYKQVKNELGWADFQVRSDVAIRRHLTLVCCAFSFSWQTWSDQQLPTPTPETTPAEGSRERGARTGFPANTTTQLAPGDPRRPRLTDPRHRAHTPVAGMVHNAPTR